MSPWHRAKLMKHRDNFTFTFHFSWVLSKCS
jgi:hypothetical protein